MSLASENCTYMDELVAVAVDREIGGLLQHCQGLECHYEHTADVRPPVV
jgi:hypothetical protein